MAELLDILDAFSTPLKMAWVVWLAWGIAQIYWYRYERKPQAAKPAVASARKPFASRSSLSLPGRPVTRLVTPEQVLPREPAHAEPPAVEGPGRIDELDQFVASFEMNSRGRREQPLNVEPARM